MKIFFLPFCLLAATVMNAQVSAVSQSAQGSATPNRNKIGIRFVCECDDMTGQTFATAFRDLLATSPRYYETSAVSGIYPDGKERTNLQVKVVSVDITQDNSESSSAIAAVFLIGDTVYLTQIVARFGRHHASEEASVMLSSLDNIISAALK